MKVKLILFIFLALNINQILFLNTTLADDNINIQNTNITLSSNVIDNFKSNFLLILEQNSIETVNNFELSEKKSLQMYDDLKAQSADFKHIIQKEDLLNPSLNYQAIDIANKLLDEETININFITDNGLNSLQLAIIHYAKTTNSSSEDIIKKLLNKGIDPNYSSFGTDNFNKLSSLPALHTAILLSQEEYTLEIVKTLLENKVTPNAQDYEGRTALMLAFPKTKIFEELLNYNADYINIINNKGLNGINYGLNFNPKLSEYQFFINNIYPKESIELLLNKNPNFNLLSINDYNSLMLAVLNPYTPENIFNKILESDIDFNYTTRTNETAFNLAIKSWNINALNSFIKNKNKIINSFNFTETQQIEMNDLTYNIPIPKYFIPIDKEQILEFKNIGKNPQIAEHFKAIFILEKEKNLPLNEVKQFFAIINAPQHEALNSFDLQLIQYQSIINNGFGVMVPLFNYLTEKKDYLSTDANNENELTLTTILGKENNHFVLLYYRKKAVVTEEMQRTLLEWQFQCKLLNKEQLETTITNKYNLKEMFHNKKMNAISYFAILQAVIIFLLVIAVIHKFKKRKKLKEKNN